MKKTSIIALIILAIIALVTIFVNIVSNRDMDEVSFYFFSLKDADASIVTYKNTVIMIDTGEEKDKKEIQEELKGKKIQKIDYLILTHPDKDHIGNAKYLIENYEIGTIFQTDYDKDSELQEELNRSIEENKIENELVSNTVNIQIENMIMEIQPPNAKYKDSNNNSLVVTISYNGKIALFAGDIKEERMEEILPNLEEVDLLKYPYHGRKSKLSKEFIQKLKPKMTVITGANPDENIISNLKNIGSKVRLTSEQYVEIIFE